jgi:hypothetical protein
LLADDDAAITGEENEGDERPQVPNALFSAGYAAMRNNVALPAAEGQNPAVERSPSEPEGIHPYLTDSDSSDSDEEDKEDKEDTESKTESDEFDWITSKAIGNGRVSELDDGDKHFWKELIDKYLYPLIIDKTEREKAALQLKELRNKATFAFLLIDVLLIALLETVSFSIDTDSSLGIKWNCTDPISHDETQVELDPFAILFIIVFGILVAIQFLCMFSHRLMTWVQFVSITAIRPKGKKKKGDAVKDKMEDLANIDAEEVVEMVMEMANIDQGGGSERSRLTPVPEVEEEHKQERLGKKLNCNRYRRRTKMTMDRAFKDRLNFYRRQTVEGSGTGAGSLYNGSQAESSNIVRRRNASNKEMELVTKYAHMFRNSSHLSQGAESLSPDVDYDD